MRFFVADPSPLAANVIGVGNDVLVYASAEGKALNALREALDSGGDPTSTGVKYQAIPLARPVTIRADKRAPKLTVTYKVGKNKSKISNIDLPDEVFRDEVFDEISRALGTSPADKDMTPARAAVAPIIAAAVCSGAGFLLYQAAKQIAESGETPEVTGRRQLIKRIFAWTAETLGPTGSLVVASIAVLVCIGFLVKRVRTPPMWRELRLG